jgi:hypothetical protein
MEIRDRSSDPLWIGVGVSGVIGGLAVAGGGALAVLVALPEDQAVLAIAGVGAALVGLACAAAGIALIAYVLRR